MVYTMHRPKDGVVRPGGSGEQGGEGDRHQRTSVAPSLLSLCRMLVGWARQRAAAVPEEISLCAHQGGDFLPFGVIKGEHKNKTF